MVLIRNYKDGKPIISTTLFYKSKISNLDGLIDSGAGITTVSKKYLKKIGVDLAQPDTHIDIKTADGNTYNAPVYKITIELDSAFLNLKNFPVACSENDYDYVALLIGMDILNYTVLVLNGNSQNYIISI